MRAVSFSILSLFITLQPAFAAEWTGKFRGVAHEIVTTNYWFRPPEEADNRYFFSGELHFKSGFTNPHDPVETFEYISLQVPPGGQSLTFNDNSVNFLKFDNGIWTSQVWDFSTLAGSNGYTFTSLFFDESTRKGSGGGFSYVQVNTFEIDSLITQVSFNITSGGIYAVVPEPGSWALMIAGFGFAGGALRRRPSYGAKKFAAT